MSASSDYLNALTTITTQQGQAAAEAARRNAENQAATQRANGQIWAGTLQSLGQLPALLVKSRQDQQDRQALQQDRQAQAVQRTAETQKVQAENAQAAQESAIFAIHPGDLDGAISELATVNPVKAQALQQHVNEAKSAALDFKSKQLKGKSDELNFYAEVLGPVKDQQTYTKALYTAQQAGLDISQFSPDYETAKPQLASLQQGTETGRKQLEAAQKALDDQRKNLVPIPGPDGKPVYGTQTAGAPVYEKPPIASTANPTEASLALAAARGGPEGVAAKQALAIMRGQRVGAGDASTVKPVLDAQGQPVTGDDLLKTLPTGQAVLVKKLAEGKMAFPTGQALKSDYWQKLLEQVGQYDPNFDAINYNARSATRKDFTSGKSADSIRAMNTVVGHIAQLSDAADALKNKNTQGYNQIANALATEFGWTGKTDFDTIAPKVAQELTRVWRGTGGSESDIQRDLDNLSSSNAPAQLHSSIGNLGKLIESQLGSMQEKYRQGMGINDIQMISPEARRSLDKLETRAGGKPAGSSAPTVGSIVTFQGKRYTVTGITNGQADLEPVQ